MKLERIYFATLILLILHQIDAAFWKEWEMFMSPGGVQGFLLFNLIAFPPVVIGYKKVVLKLPNYKNYSYFCASLGILTFVIHMGFFLFGMEQFNLPFSILIIILCFLSGVMQIWSTKKD